jgi:lipopolysaccharide transport system ATP-binding protein
MGTVIQVENLSKSYLIGHQSREPYLALRDVMVEIVKNAGRRILHPMGAGSRNSSLEEIWALKDVSFEVKQGDRVGIIGRNGAGKSTLLKILSRITEPTRGRVRIKGRVGSLLEVGTGFHPELTGRENIFLNGAILGMTKAEIKRKFDEIVDFAEIEKFLDTPVKRYSSGMYVRLAFSVAAHLEPEILIVDEVLAVGDAAFQKKCLEKLGDVTGSGQTVLLVSHNMTSVLELSSKCLLLAEGRIIEYGDPRDIVSLYQSNMAESSIGRSDLTTAEHYGTGDVRFEEIRLTCFDVDGKVMALPVPGSDLEILVTFRARQKVTNATVAAIIYDDLGNRIVDVNTLIRGDSVSLEKGEIAIGRFRLKNLLLKPDIYTVALWLGILNHADYDGVRYATMFRMEARRDDIRFTNPFPGVYVCDFEHDIRISGVTS